MFPGAGKEGKVEGKYNRVIAGCAYPYTCRILDKGLAVKQL